jgi:hypothetical protein
LTKIEEFLTCTIQTENRGNTNTKTAVKNSELHQEIGMKAGAGKGKVQITAKSMVPARAWTHKLVLTSTGAVQQ